jgi:hypothetical protein
MTGTAVAAQVTIGSTSGKPSASICAPAIKCTYLTQLQVPSNGTVSSFSVNSGSASGTVWLRVVHFYHGSIAYVDTSPPQTLAVGVNTFNVSMGVQAGDQLALDNDSSALLFDTSDPSAGTVYFQPPLPSVPLTTAGQTGRGRLLLSATLQSSGTPTTTAPPAPPSITSISQSHRRWRLDGLVARFATAAEPPVGTTFRFSLNEQVSVRFAFSRLLPGRRVNGKCVAQTTANRNRPACTRSVPRGALAFSASAGPHQLFFQGRVSRTRKLKPGTYTLSITAVNSVAESVTRTLRSFMIVGT